MFHLHVSAYINDRLKKTKMTYRDLAARSGVPLSTIYGYARGQVNKPDDDALIRIAAAFGDGEDVIRQMHVDSLPSTTEENMIFAAASDQLLLEKLALLIRENFVAVMDDYVSSEERQYRERLATCRPSMTSLWPIWSAGIRSASMRSARIATSCPVSPWSMSAPSTKGANRAATTSKGWPISDC